MQSIHQHAAAVASTSHPASSKPINDADRPTDCPGCGSRAVAQLSAIPDAFEFAGAPLDSLLPGGHLYTCHDCNLHWRYPQLDKNELDVLYRKGSSESWQDNPAKRLDWQLCTEIIRKHDGVTSVLDVGCFDGRFLDFLGEPFQRYGIEVHPLAAEHAAAKGIQVIADDFAKIDLITTQFDAVVAMDVIEHVHNPAAFLESLAKVTRPGGLILVSTGNTAALPWRLMGGMYWYCSIAEHLSFINPDWCEKISDKTGLEIAALREFSHEPTNAPQATVQAMANLFYRCLPKLAFKLRCQHAQLKGQRIRPTFKTPPHWRSAKDHFLVAFRVPILTPTNASNFEGNRA